MTLSKITRQLFPKLFITTLFLLILTTCKEDAPTEPEGSNNNGNVLASSTIGPSGGELKTESFSLSVPAGSFQSETTLSLSISHEPSFLEENSISKSFSINGLPDQFEKPIRIKIKYEGELSDSSYIARTMIGEDNITGKKINISYYMQTSDSSGYLIGEIISQSKQSTNILIKASVPEIINNVFEGITNIETVKTSKFVIEYPSIYSETRAKQFGELLENTLSKIITELGFIFNNDEGYSCIGKGSAEKYCWDWPRYIYVGEISDIVRFGYAKFMQFPRGPIINVDGTIMGSSIGEEAELLIGQTFLEIALRTNLRYHFSTSWWFGYAIGNWLEEFFNLIKDKEPPSSLAGNELTPFYGLQAGESNYSINGIKHGDGMVTLIKYLLKYKFLEVHGFQQIINYMLDNNTHLVRALLANVNGLVAEWWPDYFQKLIMGEIYNVNSSVFLDSKDLGGTWDIKPETDTVESFTLEYPDLSAKRFIINLNYPDIDESAKLSLDAFSLNNDGIATILFGVKSDGDFQHIITAKNTPLETPESLKNYYDEGIRKFLVVVVNSIHNATDYLGKTDIELVAEIKKETTLPDPTTCEVKMRFYGKTHEVIDYYNNVSLIDKDTTYWHNNNFVFPENTDGSFAGNTFTYEYVQDYDNGYSYDVHLTITFSNDKNEIVSMIYRSTTSFAGDGGEWIENRVYHLESIPLENVESAYQEATYSLDGENLCNSIVDISYSYEKETFDWLHESKNLVEFICNEDSYISIVIK